MNEVFRLDRRFVLRMIGWQLAYCGVGVIVAVLLWPLDNWLGVVGRIAAALALVSGLFALRLIVLPAPLAMKVTEHGYRAGWRAGGRRVRGTWPGVHRVTVIADGSHLAFDVAGRERQVFWLALVGRRELELQKVINQRLNDSRGYRRLS